MATVGPTTTGMGMGYAQARKTGVGIEPGAGSGNTPERAGSDLVAEVMGYLGFPHTPAVEAGFKRRGKRAYVNRKQG